MLRFFALLLLFTACSGPDSSTSNAASNSETTETQDRSVRALSSSEEAGQRIIKSLSEAVSLSDEQKVQINEIVKQYELAQLNGENNQRTQLREAVKEQVLRPDQVTAWAEKLKKKRSSVTIE